MKILYIIDSLSGGGAEKLLHDILPRIKMNHECEVLLLTDKNDKYSLDLKTKGIKINIIPFGNHFRRIIYIKKYIQKNSFDIVHANLFPVTYYCSVVKRIITKNCPIFVMTEHSTDNHRRHIRWVKPIDKWIYYAYDHIISISDKTQTALLEWIDPKNRDNYSVIYNGIPLEEFHNAVPLNRKDLIPNVSKSDIILCMIGSFTEQKGHSFILDVMHILPDKYHLICLGEGPLLKKMKYKAEYLKLQQRVHFLGFRRDVADILHTIDISVVPSKWEGFGLAAVEAMACGNPVVATNVPGLSEIISDAGIKISFGDIENFAKAILNVDLNKKRDNVKKQAEKYDIKIMIEKYISIYVKYLSIKNKV